MINHYKDPYKPISRMEHFTMNEDIHFLNLFLLAIFLYGSGSDISVIA